MDLFLDITLGIGLALAAGLRPFVPALLVGALAGADLGVDLDHTSYSFIESPAFLLAVTLGLVALLIGELVAGPDRVQRGPLGAAVSGISLGLGAILFAGVLSQHGDLGWPGLPAGLACAHRLALLGHTVMVFEARPKPGGLNEYGIAAYKMADDFAQAEVAFVLGIGGIEVEYDCRLGEDISLATLRADHDAVFLACGQAGVRALALEGEALPGVVDAVAFIAGLRQSEFMPVGRRVVVIGGGNTAIDAAVQARLLGAEEVTIAYRRGPETMSATAKEQAWARLNEVRILHWARPTALVAAEDGVAGVAFTHGRTGAAYTLAADMVLKAVGQILVPEPAEGVAVAEARIMVDNEGRTSVPGIYAGGDCVAGPDLTVQAVQDGKRAAEAIHRDLTEAGWPS